jgi:L-fuconolactonase
LTRRRFIKTAAAMGMAALSTHAEAGDGHAGDSTIPIVDTHQHLWDLSKLRLTWLADPDQAYLRRSFLLKDYDVAATGLNVVKTIYMEVTCDPAQQDLEAEYVIGLCRTPGNRMSGAIIGGTPASEGFGRYIHKYADNQCVKGLRTVLNDPDRPKGMCLGTRFVDSIRLLGQLGKRFDLCMRPGELMDGVELIDKCPKTPFIIDHCGCMSVQSTDRQLHATWEKAMKAAAARPQVICKISGLVFTAKPKVWKPSDLAPIVDFCLDTFGEDRVVFGSDWPVSTLTATYRQWVEALRWIVRDRSPAFQRKLFHDNAVKFYALS